MNIQLFKRLLQFLKPYKSKVVLALLCSTIVGAIATSPVPLIQKTFDDIFTNRDFFLLKVVPLVFVLLYFIKGGLSYIQNLLIYGVSWELVVSLRKKMFKHLHSLPLGFFEEGTTGQLISRIINDVSIMQSSVTSLVKETLQSGIMFIGLLCWIFYLKWDWALIALIILPVAV
ncbi:MAG: ABC transporter transmembrane domain-containing protein, partial [Nitrospinales bacterium]